MHTGFYVTVQQSETQPVRFARGPWATHADALAKVEETRQAASQIDPWTDFYGWGTTKLESPQPLTPAPMNRLFPN